ncbi:hypothetical protein L596_012180 [Steinernema carpocapsae]|uniref:Uncharacterized protein n=1 Tax=Steinernema carpocapsae TaxID=34508 RepID=A0A4U5NX61_STECR|nr:hypothetical protein L596_012180 [Steinernema carpocapsae]
MKFISAIESLFTKKSSEASHSDEPTFRRGLSLRLSRRRSRSCDPSKRSFKKTQPNISTDRADAKRIAMEILAILENRQRDEATKIQTENMCQTQQPVEEKIPWKVRRRILAEAFGWPEEELQNTENAPEFKETHL